MNKMMKRVIVGVSIYLAIWSVSLIGARASSPQVPISGRVVGTIRNEAGVPQSGITVTLTFKGRPGAAPPPTPVVRQAVSQRDGLFWIDQVEPGVYDVTVGAPGGRTTRAAEEVYEGATLEIEVLTAKAKVVEIIIGKKSRIAATADVPITDTLRAKVVTLVEFQLGGGAREPVVNTVDPALGRSLDPRWIIGLPLKGRNYLDLLLLEPGVVEGNGGEGFGSVNGGRATAQNYTLDGTENTDSDIALPSLFENGAIALDAIQDFRVIRSNANAEFGRNSGGQVSLFIKRGSHEVHGSVYEFFSSDRLNARDFFDRDPVFAHRGFKPPLTRHQFGATVGGPLARRGHFFFANYGGYRNREGLPRHPRVPTASLRQELASTFEFVDFDPRTGWPIGTAPSPLLVALFLRGYPLPTRELPATAQRLFPAGFQTEVRALQASPDVGVFDTTVPLTEATDSFILRTDHELGRKNRLHVRYALSDGTVSIVGNGLPGSGAGKDFRPQNVSLVNTHVFNNAMSNEVRFGFSRNRVFFPTAATPPEIQQLAGLRPSDVIPQIPPLPLTFAQVYRDIGFGPDNSSFTGFPHIVFETGRFADFGVEAASFPQGRARNTFQFGDTFSLVRGRHAMRAGFDIRRLQQNSISGFNLRPTIIVPDVSVESLFVDRVVGGRQNFFLTRDGQPNGPILRGLRSTEWGFFFQDTVKLTPRLTLDLGLRYELFGREREVQDFLSRAVNFTFTAFSPSATVSPSFAVRALGPAVGFTVRNGDRNDFGPRLGLAWDMLGTGRLVLRAAYGMYYDHIQGSTIFPTQVNPPGVLGFVIPMEVAAEAELRRDTRIGEIPVPRSRDGFVRPCQLTAGATGFLDAVGRCVAIPMPVAIIDPNLRDPYTGRWSLTLAGQIHRAWSVELSYVGSKGTKLARARTVNLGPFLEEPFLERFFGRRRPNLGFGEIWVQESSASSLYHALQLDVQHSMRGGLMLRAAYTFSKSLDDASSNIRDAGRGGSIFPQNSFDFVGERGLSAFHTAHRLVLSYLYDLPFGPGKPVLGQVAGWPARLIGDWAISGITVFQTGFPLTLLAGLDVNADGVLNDRPVVVGSLSALRGQAGGEKTRYFGDPTGIVTPGRGERLDPFNPPPFYSGNLLRPFDPRILAPRSSFIGPGRNKFDLAVRKFIGLDRLRPGLNAEFRAEFFNLFNHPNFADPDVVITSPQFGEITATTTGGRNVQFALRIQF